MEILYISRFVVYMDWTWNVLYGVCDSMLIIYCVKDRKQKLMSCPARVRYYLKFDLLTCNQDPEVNLLHLSGKRNSN